MTTPAKPAPPSPPPSYVALFAAEWLAIELRREMVSRRREPQPSGRLDAKFSWLFDWERYVVRGRLSPALERLSPGEMSAAPSEPPPLPPPAAPRQAPEELVGLAFSGGGIRSATFSLGVLQAFREQGLLGMFDYISTVSGGGFTGGWWSAWLSRDERGERDIFPPRESLESQRHPPELREEQELNSNAPARTEPDGSRSVGLDDPINHVRLFSNYLTPRKGVLSADTWRAAAVISRNLLLTWIMLLPLLFAAIVLAQTWFAGHDVTGPSFVCSRPDAWRADTLAGSKVVNITRSPAWAVSFPCSGLHGLAAEDGTVDPTLPHADHLRARWQSLGPVLATSALILLLCVLLWLPATSSHPLFAWIGFLIVGACGYRIYGFFAVHTPDTGASGWFYGLEHQPAYHTLRILAAVVVVLLLALWLLPIRRRITRGPISPSTLLGLLDVLRGWYTRALAIVLMVSAATLIILLVGGFGHEVVWFLFAEGRSAATKAGGWGGLIVSVATALYTGLKAAPSVHPEASKGKQSVRNAVFMVAPGVVLLALALGLSALGRLALQQWGDWYASAWLEWVFTFALFVPAFWAGIEGVRERRQPELFPWKLTIFLLFAVAGALIWLSAALGWRSGPLLVATWQCWALVGAALGMLLARFAVVRDESGWGVTWEVKRFGHTPIWPSLLLPAVAALLAVLLGSQLTWSTATVVNSDTLWSIRSAVGALAFVVLVVLGDLLTGSGRADRTTWLYALVGILASGLLLAYYGGYAQWHGVLGFGAGGFALAGASIAWVVAIGWWVNPNALSLHSFYRTRLVRAYLGASNKLGRQGKEITDGAEGDDVPLTHLRNHFQGAPLHLINTTLNLTGGGDLGTAQRSAENFVLSKFVCGSPRAMYCDTSRYMAGGLSLGTAVATSGAAVSPTMGSETPSAALTMLLSLLNVRIGFWAPTPGRKHFDKGEPRLWPFYLLRESLSQTNELGSYCYLTDGGHFDNTGLYALIERGCQFIVVADDGADPLRQFGDIGRAIRRARIDFGVEMDLLSSPLAAQSPDQILRKHWVAGRFRYSRRHLETLGVTTRQEIEQRTHGIIVWIKPSALGDEPLDVAQYGNVNRDFPQQSTGDQWYDEAQFESYRALGHHSGRRLIRQLLGERTAEIPGTANSPAGVPWDDNKPLPMPLEDLIHQFKELPIGAAGSDHPAFTERRKQPSS